jgi:hypothetical protein
MKTFLEMPSSKELIDQYMKPESHAFMDALISGRWKEELIIEEMQALAIPIYTLKNPNPKNRKEDCDLIIQYKKRMREQMKKELEQIIGKYEHRIRTNT